MFIVDPQAPVLTERQRKLLKIREMAIMIAMEHGRLNAGIPTSPAYYYKHRAIEILYSAVSGEPFDARVQEARARSGTRANSLDIWAADIGEPGPALRAVASLVNMTMPIYMISGKPRKVLFIQWESFVSPIEGSSLARGPWEDYLLGFDLKNPQPDFAS